MIGRNNHFYRAKRLFKSICKNVNYCKQTRYLLIAREEINFQKEEKEKRAAELILANLEYAFQSEEKAKRAAELVVANKELAFQNEEKGKRVAELVIANKELAFQNCEKEKRASELIIANNELAFQNEEKEKRAAELLIANKELAFQNREKENRASELIIANKELAFQNEEKEKRAAELLIASKELLFQKEKTKLQAQVQPSDKMASLGILAGGIAHDMNNVLGAVLGLASAHLEIQPKTSSTYRAFDTIAKAALRGGKMVQSLLSFARENPAEERELDMNEILREEVQILACTTLSKIRLEMHLATDLQPIRGDASALTHAFMNLCVNAVDAMTDHGVLTLRTRNLDQDWIEVVVADTGTGMSKEVLEKALDPFFTTKGVGRGTGLGLSMVYSTVQAHRGQLELQSELGQGTVVTLRFPACAPMGKPAEPLADLGAEPRRGALAVLLVDDDELLQSSTHTLLALLGHTTTTVASGEAALAKLEAGFQPDVVILDMNMPGLGGGGTLPRLRTLRPTLPVLLATGRVDQTALNLVEGHSYVTLMSKPYSMGDLKKNLEPHAIRKAGEGLDRDRP